MVQDIACTEGAVVQIESTVQRILCLRLLPAVQQRIFLSTHLGAREQLVDELVDGRGQLQLVRGSFEEKKIFHVDR